MQYDIYMAGNWDKKLYQILGKVFYMMHAEEGISQSVAPDYAVYPCFSPFYLLGSTKCQKISHEGVFLNVLLIMMASKTQWGHRWVNGSGFEELNGVGGTFK